MSKLQFGSLPALFLSQDVEDFVSADESALSEVVFVFALLVSRLFGT